MNQVDIRGTFQSELSGQLVFERIASPTATGNGVAERSDRRPQSSRNHSLSIDAADPLLDRSFQKELPSRHRCRTLERGYLAALDRYRQNYADPLVELLTTEAPARELIREVLVGLVDEIVKDGTRMACLIVGAATERIHLDAQVAQRVRSTTQSLEDAFTTLIADAQAAGQISTATPARSLARLLVMATHGLRVSGAINPDRCWLMSVVEEVINCVD
jgi:TetR/AcrR family transcriptional repressor of nem operon